MSVEHCSVATTRTPEEPCRVAGQAARGAEPETGPSATARRLVRAAILRGLLLDDPWRHAFLRNRWMGA